MSDPIEFYGSEIIQEIRRELLELTLKMQKAGCSFLILADVPLEKYPPLANGNDSRALMCHMSDDASKVLGDKGPLRLAALVFGGTTTPDTMQDRTVIESDGHISEKTRIRPRPDDPRA